MTLRQLKDFCDQGIETTNRGDVSAAQRVRPYVSNGTIIIDFYNNKHEREPLNRIKAFLTLNEIKYKEVIGDVTINLIINKELL